MSPASISKLDFLLQDLIAISQQSLPTSGWHLQERVQLQTRDKGSGPFLLLQDGIFLSWTISVVHVATSCRNPRVLENDARVPTCPARSTSTLPYEAELLRPPGRRISLVVRSQVLCAIHACPRSRRTKHGQGKVSLLAGHQRSYATVIINTLAC